MIKRKIDLDSFCYKIKQKVMRLCCLGMASDGSLSVDEKQTIVEILLRDVARIKEDVIRESLDILITPQNPETPDFFPLIEFQEDDFKENKNSIRLRYIYREKEYIKTLPLNENSKVYKLYKFRCRYRGESYLKEMYCLAFMYVEFLYRLIKSNPTYCQNVFLNIDNIKRHERLKEVQDMFLVIRADSQISSVEYSAIIAILKIFKVANSEFVWNKLLAENKENLLKSNNFWFRINTFFQYTVRKEINVYDVEEIQQILAKKDFKGILANEISNAVKHAKKIKERTINKNRQKLFEYSLYIFVISAILTFFNCAFRIENKKIATEYNLKDTSIDRAYIAYARRNMAKDEKFVTKSIMEYYSISNGPITDSISELVNKVMADNSPIFILDCISELVNKVFQNNSISNGSDTIISDSSANIENDLFFNDHTTEEVKNYAINLIDSITNNCLHESIYMEYALSHLSLNGDEVLSKITIKNASVVIFISGFLLILLKIIDKNVNRKSNILKLIIYLLFATFITRLIYNYVGEPRLVSWYNTFLVAVMMISIEIMVLTRELSSKRINFISDETKKISHQSSKGLLIVFVLAAIIADMCIGYIELPYLNSENTDFYQYMLNDKLASALLLGCISFFTGKFIEQHSIQQEIDIETMKVAIEDLDKIYK